MGTFNWNATHENVGYVWNQKPSLSHRITLKFCITPPGAAPGATRVTSHSVLVTHGGRAAVQTKP